MSYDLEVVCRTCGARLLWGEVEPGGTVAWRPTSVEVDSAGQWVSLAQTLSHLGPGAVGLSVECPADGLRQATAREIAKALDTHDRTPRVASHATPSPQRRRSRIQQRTGPVIIRV